MCELLERARKEQGNISYYEVGKRLGVSTPLMNKWKNNKSKPNGIHTLELAILANLSAQEALELMKNGFTTLSQLFVTALLSTLAIAGYLISSNCILC